MNAHQNLSRFALHAETLVRNGYRPLPGYQDTKRPSINKWDQYCNRQWEPQELADMIAGRGQQEGKMVCLAIQKELVAIDLDIDDQYLMDFVDNLAVKHFGKTPLIRIGRQPRMVLMYRNAGDIRSRKYHPIEVFAGSGQIVGFGYHMGAKRDYEWLVRSPLDLPADDPLIPMISQQQLDAFLNDCRTRITFKTAPATEYMQSLYLGDTLIKDREAALTQINQEATVAANAPEGARNESLFHLCFVAGQAIGAGLVTPEEVEPLILNAAEACGLMAVGDEDGIKEVRNTIKSGFTSGHTKPFFVVSNWFEKQETLEIQVHPRQTSNIHYDEKKPFTFPPSLIKGLLPRNGVAFIGGQSGAGKTFLVCDLAVALTTQQAFFGHKVKEKVGVAILAGEGAETLQPRITIARMGRNIDDTLPIAWISNLPNLADPSAAAIVMPQLKEVAANFQSNYGVRLGLVVLDTLAATFMLQDENDNSEASKIIRVLSTMSQALDCLVMPVHHYGKGAETGLRGASAWRAGSDAVLSVTAERNHLTGVVSEHKLWLAKSRVGEEGPVGDFALRTMLLGVDEDGDELTSCYVVPEVAHKPSVAERREAEAVALEMLSGGEWRADPRSEHWAGVAIAEAYGLDLTNKTQLAQVKLILKRLISEDKLSEEMRKDDKRMLRKYIMSVAPVAAPVAKQDILSDDFSVFD